MQDIDLTIGIFMNRHWIFIRGDDKILFCSILKSLEAKCMVIESIKTWLFPLQKHDILVKSLRDHKIQVSPVPEKLLTLFQTECVEYIDNQVLSNLSSYKLLSDYQKKSVHFMISKGGRAMNASEMGTGKTATGICISEYYYSLQPQLIICPSGLKNNWKNEFSKFARKKVHIVQTSKDLFENDINIISYSLLSKHNINDIENKFQVLILDESHYIKNRFSNRFKVIYKMSRFAKKVILLSGTPNSKSVELYSQLQVINPNFFKNFFCFKPERKTEAFCFACRYCDPKKVFIGNGKYGYKFDGNSRSWELNAILSLYMTRVKKEEVLELPEKKRHAIMFDTLCPIMKEEFKNNLKIVETTRQKKGIKASQHLLMDIVRKTAHMKIPIISSYVNYIINKNDKKKYLFFAHHKIILKHIENLLLDNKKTYIYIDGSTRPDQRQKNVDLFQNDKANINFAILSIKAAGTGLNLYKGNIVVFFEILWSEKDMIQAEDRVHRRNLSHNMEVYYIILKYSTDEIIMRTIQNKYQNVGMILDNKSVFLDYEKKQKNID